MFFSSHCIKHFDELSIIFADDNCQQSILLFYWQLSFWGIIENMAAKEKHKTTMFVHQKHKDRVTRPTTFGAV